MRLYGSRALAWFLVLYSVALLLLMPRLTLWLDEVLTLSGAGQPDLAAMMENLRRQQGATPLAFLIPHWTIQLLGTSLFSARIMSAIPSAAACPAMFALARRAGLRAPMLAVLAFALWPLQLRYALEARPYALALCLGMWLTVVFLPQERPWRTSQWVIYAGLTLLMGATHPYSLAIPGAHLLWALRFDRARVAPVFTGLAITTLALLPWYVHFSAGWRAISGEQQLTSWNSRAVLVFLREFAGSGYSGMTVLLVGCLFSLRRSLMPPRFWLFAALVPIVATPVANIAFDYFFAVRQMIFILPAVALLFCAGAERWGRAGCWLVAAFLALSIYEDVRYFRRPREDWNTATQALISAVDAGACVTFVGDSRRVYIYFNSALSEHECGADAGLVAVAISPYGNADDAPAAERQLLDRGLVKQSEQSFVGPRVELFGK